MSAPLVSICIPTYNRAQYLRKSLESIVTQKEFLIGLIEVVISDNASTDNTQEVGQEFDSKYENIHYFRNPKNIIDANFPLAFRRGNGKLLKLCNDTLEYKLGAFKLFCDCVKKYEKTKPLLWFSNGNKEINLKIKNQNEIISFEDFMQKASYWTTWIGAFSWWKEDFDSMGPDTESYTTRLWQVKQICRIMSLKNSSVIIPNQFCVTQTVEKKDISYGIYQVFYTNYLGIIKEFLKNNEKNEKYFLSNKTYEQLKKDLLLDFFPPWIAGWELQNKKLDYSKSEDLKEKVFEIYKNESYFNQFKKIYKKILFSKKYIEPVKNILKKPYKAIFKK